MRLNDARGLFALVLLSMAGIAFAQQQPVVSSQLVQAGSDDLVLVQELMIDANVSKVWKAYTTDAGWMQWAAPLAQIDLRIGGLIQTHYEPGASIGDAGTNTLHIINFVPERLLTLQAELSDRWPEVMKQDGERLMNVIVFQPIGSSRTQVLSYGVGYRDVPAYQELMQFFIPANEQLLLKLKAYLEAN